MFAIGETSGKVIHGKLALPKEFQLKKKKIIAKWRDGCTLYLSDNDKSLNYIAGKENVSFIINLDWDDKLSVPEEYEDYSVEIKGCISTIELTFKKIKRRT